MSLYERNFVSERRITRIYKQSRILDRDLEFQVVKPEIKREFIQTKLF